MWEGPRLHVATPLQRVCTCMYMWAGLNRFEPGTDFELDNVRIGMGCMNLVTVSHDIRMQVPVTLNVNLLVS